MNSHESKTEEYYWRVLSHIAILIATHYTCTDSHKRMNYLQKKKEKGKNRKRGQKEKGKKKPYGRCFFNLLTQTL